MTVTEPLRFQDVYRGSFDLPNHVMLSKQLNPSGWGNVLYWYAWMLVLWETAMAIIALMQGIHSDPILSIDNWYNMVLAGFALRAIGFGFQFVYNSYSMANPPECEEDGRKIYNRKTGYQKKRACTTDVDEQRADSLRWVIWNKLLQWHWIGLFIFGIAYGMTYIVNRNRNNATTLTMSYLNGGEFFVDSGPATFTFFVVSNTLIALLCMVDWIYVVEVMSFAANAERHSIIPPPARRVKANGDITAV